MEAPPGAGLVEFHEVPADGPAALALIRELDAEIEQRYPGAPFHGLRPGEHLDPKLRFFVVSVDSDPVACGALRRLEPGVVELKRMFVRLPCRKRGLARALLAHLEREAYRDGARCLRLETGVRQPEAISLYQSSGYAPIARYGEFLANVDSRCMEKRLVDDRGAS